MFGPYASVRFKGSISCLRRGSSGRKIVGLRLGGSLRSVRRGVAGPGARTAHTSSGALKIMRHIGVQNHPLAVLQRLGGLTRSGQHRAGVFSGHQAR